MRKEFFLFYMYERKNETQLLKRWSPWQLGIEAYIPWWAEEKCSCSVFRGEEEDSQEDGKNKCLVNKWFPCNADDCHI